MNQKKNSLRQAQRVPLGPPSASFTKRRREQLRKQRKAKDCQGEASWNSFEGESGLAGSGNRVVSKEELAQLQRNVAERKQAQRLLRRNSLLRVAKTVILSDEENEENEDKEETANSSASAPTRRQSRRLQNKRKRIDPSSKRENIGKRRTPRKKSAASKGKEEEDVEDELVSSTKRKKRRGKKSKVEEEEEEEEEEEVSPLGPLTRKPRKTHRCRHTISIKLEWIKSSLFRPECWSCTTCSTTASVWACLECPAQYGCGGEEESHALNHYKETGHSLVLEINTLRAYCFTCDAFVCNDNSQGDLQWIKTRLQELETQTFQPSTTRSGMVLHAPSEWQQQISTEKWEQRDRMYNALLQWKLNSLSYALNKWRSFATAQAEIQEKKRKQEIEKEKRLNEKDIPFSSRPKLSLRRSQLLISRDLGKNKPVVPRRRIGGRTGLRNLGNTCFLNAVIQALGHTDSFHRFFTMELVPSAPLSLRSSVIARTPSPLQVGNIPVMWRKNTIDCLELVRRTKTDQSKLTLCMELHNLFRVLWSGKWSVVTPAALLRAVWKYIPAFKNYQQQDAQEFFALLREHVQSELLKGSRINDDENLVPIRDVTKCFDGKQCSTVTCLSCGHVSPTESVFSELAVDIPVVHIATGRSRGKRGRSSIPEISLHDCVSTYVSPEELPKLCYDCEGCKKKTNAIKQFSIVEFPQVLCVVLKRFVWTATSRAKIDTKVNLELEDVDFSYLAQNPKAVKARNHGYEARYRLTSMVVHHGSSIQVGHYTAYCYHDESDQWMHFNDTVIKSCEMKEILDVPTPYLLFFERIHPPFVSFS